MSKGIGNTRVGRATRGMLMLALGWFFLMGTTMVAWASPGDEGDAIDQYIHAQMAAGQIPGVALAIVRDDQIVSLRSYGVASPDGRPMTPQTPMVVGSVSKPLTALATLQLVEQGKLDLDAPVQTYLPWFRLADPDAAAQITVRQLLAHTSGFSTAQGRAGLARNGWDEDALAQYGWELATMQPPAAPGKLWQYSNVNYSLLGLLIQTVSGVPYEQYMHEQVFSPLEMVNSFARLDVARQHDLAVGYRYWFDRPLPEPNPPEPRGMIPGANLIASAEDLGHVVVAQLNGGRYNGRQVLAPELVAAMQQPAADTGVPGAAYGLGLGVSLVDGRRITMHSGDTANFHSEVIFSVDGRWGVVVLMNANTSLAPTAMEVIKGLGFGVAELVAGHPVLPPAPPAGNPFWTLLSGLGIVLAVQAIRLAWSVAHVRQPREVRRWVAVRLLALAADLTLIWGVVVVLPGLLITPLDTILAYQPDIGWLMLAVGAVTLVGITARTLRLLLAGRSPGGLVPAPQHG
jgi:CubicO group peptidase (beta-lactamase class C family)